MGWLKNNLVIFCVNLFIIFKFLGFYEIISGEMNINI